MYKLLKILELKMKFLILSILFTLVFCFCSKAESDTLVITLKNNQTEKIPISHIQKIQFENITAVGELIQSRKNLVTKGNYPNPFQTQTSIEFEIASNGNVEIIIYDNSGNQIHTLKCEKCQAGKNTLEWNCLDKNNKLVQSGVYYYEVRFNHEIQSKKMILIK
jgi:flagellar hook assembly protein FlgD